MVLPQFARDYDKVLDALDPENKLRDQAIAEVDGRYGYSIEMSSCPESHRTEWDERWALLVAGKLLADGRIDDVNRLIEDGYVHWEELRQGGRLDEEARTFVPGPLWANIGTVAVVRGWPPEGNPYRAPAGQQVTGQERAMALAAFRDGDMIGDTTFWYAPSGGGARLIEHAYEIDWKGMR